MAQVSEMTIRLDILREAKDRYESLQKMVAVTTAESFVYGLKIVECEVMIKELLGTGLENDPTAKLEANTIDWGSET